MLRAGGGLFYDSSLSIATDLINSGPFNITQFTNSSTASFSSLLSYAFSPNLKLPRLTEWNLTLDQALGTHDVVSIGYVGSEGHRLFRREVGGPGNTPTALFALDHQQRRVRIPRSPGAVSPQGAAGLSVAGILLLVALAG